MFLCCDGGESTEAQFGGIPVAAAGCRNHLSSSRGSVRVDVCLTPVALLGSHFRFILGAIFVSICSGESQCFGIQGHQVSIFSQSNFWVVGPFPEMLHPQMR